MSEEQTSANINPISQDTALAHSSAGTIKRHAFLEGTTLFCKDEERHCAFLIDKGEVHIYGDDTGGEDKLLCVLGEGEIFGEMALIDNTPRTATAVAASDVEIYVIPREALHERIRGLDPIVSLLISLLIERYRLTRIHLPETIKQDRSGDFVQKVDKYMQKQNDSLLPEEILHLHNLKKVRETALKELNMEQELRQALENREFIPVLQPILKLPEQKVIGFEALIRWKHPRKGTLFPDYFIPVAERTGVVRHLDHMMLERSCEIIPVLNKLVTGVDNLFISANMSGINFGTLDIVDSVRTVLVDSGVDPSLIKLELTESALIGDSDLAGKILHGLKVLGVSIALDDFGTGYSSLEYLHKFPIDDLKIDRSFVAQLHDDNKSINIVRAIVALARNFELNVIAEGIETETDLASLNSLGCDMGQGYLFSKPLEIEAAYEFVKQNYS